MQLIRVSGTTNAPRDRRSPVLCHVNLCYVKEGQAVWQWRRRNRNHIFWCPTCSWTQQIGAWGWPRYLPTLVVVSTQSSTSTCSYACSKVFLIIRLIAIKNFNRCPALIIIIDSLAHFLFASASPAGNRRVYSTLRKCILLLRPKEVMFLPLVFVC